MAYKEKEARELVIKAGLLLLNKKLIARTWGNISARISDSEFIITPSGRAYETLTADDLVKVKIDDLSYEGNIKPSSEKAVHAALYALRDDVNFIIHTHQFYASAICAAERDTDFAPCAGYGLPGTKKLAESVRNAIAAHPEKNAFLMAKHGALCLGKDLESAFAEADRLEENCRSLFYKSVTLSEREASSGTLFGLDRLYGSVMRDTDSTVMTVCSQGKALKAHLDDFAQMIGPDARCVLGDKKMAVGALKGRNAVLLHNEGALCVAENKDDAEAVSMILRKNCAAALYVQGKRPMGSLDAKLQRMVYQMKYSKLKGKRQL